MHQNLSRALGPGYRINAFTVFLKLSYPLLNQELARTTEPDSFVSINSVIGTRSRRRFACRPPNCFWELSFLTGPAG